MIHRKSIVRMSVLVLALLVIPLALRPVAAAPPVRGLDVGRIERFVGEQAERHGIPGLALAVVDGDQVVALSGYGKADETGRAVTGQTPFVLASVSKPLTALAVMQLAEDGALELDAPVQRYLPSFHVADPAASQQITLRHLLNHTSGIPEQGCQSNRFGAETLEQFAAALAAIELDAAPGERHFYCSGNYNLLGRVIEVVSGQPYASYMEQRVFAPLQMRHSFASEQPARADGLAQGYRWLFGAAVPVEYPYEAPQAPSGFLMASAEDLAHMLVAQLNGGRYGAASVLSPEGIAAMQAPGVPLGGGAGSYGLGWRSGSLGGVPAIFHAGDNPNAHTMVFFEPQTRRGAVLLTNGQSMLGQFGAFGEIEAGVARLLAGQQPAAPSWSLPRLYLAVDVVLGALLGLALWPLLWMRRWERRLREQPGRRWWLRAGARLAAEFGLPLLLLSVAWLLLQALGAQSWGEGLLLFPDIGAWLWALSLLLVLTGLIRLALLVRAVRARRQAPAFTSTASQRPI